MSEKLTEVTMTVTQVKREVEGIECDICDKIIPAKKYYDDTNKYYRVHTGHHEWGNDSVDSIEDRDICPGCINNFIINYLANGNNSSYIDIRTQHAYPYERWEKQ